MHLQQATVIKVMPTKIWIESGIMGERVVMVQHEGCDPFEYAVFGYDYRYTSNAGTHSAAENLARALGATDPIEHKNREVQSLAAQTETTKETIGEVLTSMVSRFDAELLATPESELEKRWHFQWDDKASIEWNVYKFSDMLESYKRSCRKWEDHHNGSCCVVERVRDKYLMPKVREFIAAVHAHTNSAVDMIDNTSKGAARYEAVRKLNTQQFADIYRKNIEMGVPFDQLIDELIGSREGL
jgi:hypothetical protein